MIDNHHLLMCTIHTESQPLDYLHLHLNLFMGWEYVSIEPRTFYWRLNVVLSVEMELRHKEGSALDKLSVYKVDVYVSLWSTNSTQTKALFLTVEKPSKNVC